MKKFERSSRKPPPPFVSSVKVRKMKQPIEFLMDNKGAILLGINNNEIKRTKHVDIRYRYVRELVEEDVISLRYVATDVNHADIMTKGLNPRQFNYLIQLMNCFE